MKRPVKENITKDMDSIEIALTIQWNDCCDDWEKWIEDNREEMIATDGIRYSVIRLDELTRRGETKDKIREILKQMEVSSDTCDIEKYVNLFYQATRLDKKKINDIGIDLVDKHFPKGECQERGRAIVLYNVFSDSFGCKW